MWEDVQKNPKDSDDVIFFDSSPESDEEGPRGFPPNRSESPDFPNVAGGVDEFHSVIKLSSSVSFKHPRILDTIAWTSELDKVFISNRQFDQKLKWQYFGSVEVWRIFFVFSFFFF